MNYFTALNGRWAKTEQFCIKLWILLTNPRCQTNILKIFGFKNINKNGDKLFQRIVHISQCFLHFFNRLCLFPHKFLYFLHWCLCVGLINIIILIIHLLHENCYRRVPSLLQRPPLCVDWHNWRLPLLIEYSKWYYAPGTAKMMILK